MKKILVFGITDNPGGVESVIMNYYRKIDRKKIQFDFLCNTKVVAYSDEIEELGGTIYKVTSRRENRKMFHQEMDSFFKNHAKDYDTIWVNVCSLANIDYLKYAKKYGIKYRIIHSHNSQNMDSFLRKIFHMFNRLVVSKYATDYWTCSYDSAKWFYNSKISDNHEVLIIHNAIDLDKYKYSKNKREEIRKKMKFGNKIIIGHVGRFHFQKNHDYLIDIFNDIRKMNSNALLLLIGQGEDEEKIKNKVKELKLENSVIFAGVRSDVDMLMQGMDVFLFPSLFEGLPLVLLEAQASGLPIIASSDVIPEEACMSNSFEFISLDKPADYWAKETLNIVKNVNRESVSKDNINNITKSGYNIDKEIIQLEKYFERN